MPSNEDLRMSFFEHLGELRTRVFRVLGGMVLGFIVCYIFSEDIFNVLTVPFNEAFRNVFDKEPLLIHTGIIEPFLVYLKVSILAGLFLTCPWIFYQVWLFIAPGLHAKEKKYVAPFVFLATAFFVGGAAFGYFLVFPLGFEYFLRLTGENIEPMIRMQEYFSLSSWMLLVFGLVFEVPLLILSLAFFGKLTPKQLTTPWRAVLVGILIASAMLTPADPASMLLLAIPMIFLYGVTILLSFAVARKKEDVNGKEEEKDSGAE